MKKLISLFLFTILLSSCGEDPTLNTCKDGIVVGKSITYVTYDRIGFSKLVIRSKGKLVNVKVTNYEANQYQLGDTIK